jgi:hypothetical protein
LNGRETKADPGRSSAFWDALGWAVLLVLTTIVALTFADYGITWDEPLQNRYGKLVLDYYWSWGKDRAAFDYVNLYYYGAAFDLAAAVLNLVSPLDTYPTRHLLNALVGLLGIAGVWRLAREIGGARAGVVALVLLALTPDWYGHLFNNPKDVPFAAAMTWGLLALVRIARELPRPVPRSVALLGVAAGFALGTRVAGGLLFLYLGVLGVVWISSRRREVGWSVAIREASRASLRLVPSIVLAGVLMLILWPWTQDAPLTNPLRALREFSHFPFDVDFLFNGEYIRTTDLPWYYLPLMFLVRLPEPVLLGVAALPLLLWRDDEPHRLTRLAWVVLGVAFLFPPLYILAGRSPLYDGIRHVLFLVPLCAVLAALGLGRLWGLAARRRATKYALAALAGLWLGVQVWQFVALHPDQIVLYNRIAGGVPGAAGRFELDYWGNSLKETAEQVLTAATQRLGPDAAGEAVRVAVCGPADAVRNYFPQPWHVFVSIAERKSADIYLWLPRVPCRIPEGAEKIAETQRFGVTLSSAFLDPHRR